MKMSSEVQIRWVKAMFSGADFLCQKLTYFKIKSPCVAFYPILCFVCKKLIPLLSSVKPALFTADLIVSPALHRTSVDNFLSQFPPFLP